MFYEPKIKPDSGTWSKITLNVNTETGLVSGELADGRTFSGYSASSAIKGKTIYGITLLNQRGSNSFMKYFRNIKIYDKKNQIKAVSGAGNVISISFESDMTDIDLSDKISVVDSDLSGLEIANIEIIDDGYGAILTLASDLTVGKTYTVKNSGDYLLPGGLYASSSSKSFEGSSSACFINDFTVDEDASSYTARISATQLLSGSDDKIIAACVGEKDGFLVSISAAVKEINKQGINNLEISFDKTSGADTVYFYVWNEKSRVPMCDFKTISVTE